MKIEKERKKERKEGRKEGSREGRKLRSCVALFGDPNVLFLDLL